MGCCELATSVVRAPIVHAAPLPATLHIAAAVIPAPHLRHPRAPHRHSCAPSPSFLRRQEWWVRRSGCWRAVGRRSVLPTPHLATHAPRAARTSPTHTKQTPPRKIHPSPLLGGRLGGGWDVASWRRRSCALRSSTPRPPHCTSPPPSFLRAVFATPALPTVIPAQAGMVGEAIGVLVGGWWWLATSHPPPSLPPKRGEG